MFSGFWRSYLAAGTLECDNERLCRKRALTGALKVEAINVDGSVMDAPPIRALFHGRLFDRYGPIQDGTYEDLIFGFRAVLEKGTNDTDQPLLRKCAGMGISVDVPTTTVAQ